MGHAKQDQNDGDEGRLWIRQVVLVYTACMAPLTRHRLQSCMAGLVLLSACHLACAVSRQPPEVVRALQTGMHDDGLGPNDVISIRVFGENDLSGDYQVSADGMITLSLLGTVRVEGLRPDQVSTLLAQQLSRFFVAPQVAVLVKAYHSKKIHVLGEVRSPGTFTFESGMSIIQALTLAGGFAPLAKRDGAIVTRITAGREQRLEVPISAISQGHVPNFELRAGDIVYVPETIF